MAIFLKLFHLLNVVNALFCHYTYNIGTNFVAILTENLMFLSNNSKGAISAFFATEYGANQVIECKNCVLIPVKKSLSCIVACTRTCTLYTTW